MNSPKTPGGISKSLLTPCRRVGLSRKFRKAGTSPFVSPLSKENSSPQVKQEEKRPTRKGRAKAPQSEEEMHDICENEPDTTLEKDGTVDCDTDLVKSTPILEPSVVSTTPLRSVQHSSRNKSKTLLSFLNKGHNQQQIECISEPQENKAVSEIGNVVDKMPSNGSENETGQETVATPTRSLSKTKASKSTTKTLRADKKVVTSISDETNKASSKDTTVKEKSPNNLSNECFVVVQRKIFKDSLKMKNTVHPVSQPVTESDSDDAPLSTMTNKTQAIDAKKRPRNCDEDDFCEHPNSSVKVTKLEHKNTSTTDLKKVLSKKSIKENVKKTENSNPKHTSFDDDDDEDFVTKKTILIRKTYDKVSKPSRAKSTGSITQQDIEHLKARIETKKNLLLAKSMSNETEELRNLIKKWRKGCQEALTELTDLMKIKLGDQNMDSSDILKMLKIPMELVGYDSDNDCFITPDDSSVILYNL